MVTVNREEYIEDLENYSSWPYLMERWTVPFVTGRKYKIHWGTVGLDWDQMRTSISQRWESTDRPVYFVHNFTDVRAKMDVTFNGDEIANDTISMFPKDYETGHHVLFEDPEIREFHYVVTGKQPKKDAITDWRELKFVAHRCVGEACFEDIPLEAECDDKIRLWSNPKDWDQG
jgi:hypothetical protein